MRQFLTDIFGRKSRPIVSRKPLRTPRLVVEQLEERAVPTILFKNQFGAETVTQNTMSAAVKSAEVNFIFWGSYWGTEAGMVYESALISEAKALIGSHVLEGLKQYGSDGLATFDKSWTDTSSEPPPAASPDKLPADAVQAEIQKAIDDPTSPITGPVDHEHAPIYAVVTAPQAGLQFNGGGWNRIGTYGDYWINELGLIAAPQNTDGVDGFSVVLAHELVECVAHGTTIKQPAKLPMNLVGDTQVCDNEPNGTYVCTTNTGALAQAYWSQNDKNYIISDGHNQTITLTPNWSLDTTKNTATFNYFDLTINGDQRANPDDNIVLDTTLQGGVSVMLNGELTTFLPGQIRSITINTKGGNDVVDVRQTLASTPITVNLGRGLDSVKIETYSQDATDFQGSLQINGGAGNGILNVDDSKGPGDKDYVIGHAADGSGFIQVLAPSSYPLSGQIRFKKLTYATLSAGPGANAFDISDSLASLGTIVYGGAGKSTVNITGTTKALNFFGGSDFDSVTIGKPNASPLGDGMVLSGIVGPVNLGDQGHAMIVTIDDGGDSAAHSNVQVSNSLIKGLAPAAITYASADIGSMSVIGSTVASTYNISGAPNHGPIGSCTTHLITSADDNVVVGSTGNVQSILSQLDLSQAKGMLTVTVDDSKDKSPTSWALTAGQIGGLAPASINFEQKQLKAFTIKAGSGGNKITVLDSPDNGQGMKMAIITGAGSDTITIQGSTGELKLNGGGGTDQVIVGFNGQLDFLNGGVYVANFAGSTYLTVDDSNDGSGRTATLADGGVAYTGYAAAIQWAPSENATGGVISVALKGGPGGNNFVVNNTSKLNQATTLWTGPGDDVVHVNGTKGPLYIRGQAGSDAVTVGNGSLANIAPNVWLSNPKGHTTLLVDDSAAVAARSYRLSSGFMGDSLSITPATSIYFLGGEINSLTVNAGAGADTLDVLGLDANVNSSFNGGAGNDTLFGPNGTNTWNVTGTNSGVLNSLLRFTNTENLNGGTGVDSFRFAQAGNLTGKLNGGGGGDWLDYSGWTSSVTVNLPSATATVVAGGISNIRHVRGGDGGNTLTGDSHGNIFVGGAGADILFGGSGRSLLIGGDGADQVTGGNSDDIVINGRTIFDGDNTALAAMLAEWQSTDIFTDRQHKLTAGVGPNNIYKLDATTVLDDGVIDTLNGGAGQNWTLKGPNDP